MLKRSLNLLYLLLFLFECSIAQNTYMPRDIIKDQGTIVGFLSKIKPADSAIEGEPYLFADWMYSKIFLKTNHLFDNFKINLDLTNNEINVQTDKDIRILEGNRVLYFQTYTSGNDTTLFLNGSNFKIDNTILSGFLKVVANGKWRVLSKTEIELLPPSYYVQFNAGNQNSKYSKKEVFYISNEKNQLARAKNIKKNELQFFGEREAVVKRFMEAHKTKFSKEEDLVALVNFLNEPQ
jgi:hypothetical protein